MSPNIWYFVGPDLGPNQNCHLGFPSCFITSTNVFILFCWLFKELSCWLSTCVFPLLITPIFVYLFVCFVALRPKSTAMVIAGRSVHLTTLFSWASLNKQLTSNRAHTFACNWQQPFMNDSAEGRRMTVEIISWSISTKVWDWAGIELPTPGSAVSFPSVTRHVTICATRPGQYLFIFPCCYLWQVVEFDCLRAAMLTLHQSSFTVDIKCMYIFLFAIFDKM